jgi:hypothetical protein
MTDHILIERVTDGERCGTLPSSFPEKFPACFKHFGQCEFVEGDCDTCFWGYSCLHSPTPSSAQALTAEQVEAVNSADILAEYIDNPSAWEHFNQGVSDAIAEHVEKLRAAFALGGEEGESNG